MSITVRWLKPEHVTARWEPEPARISVRIDNGDEIVDAQVRLALPLSRPGTFVNISNAKNESLGILATLDGLDRDTRNAIESALQMRYMIPVIIQILAIQEHSPFVLRWRVETNLGERQFFTESTRESIRYHDVDRIRITDLAGNQYDITSLAGQCAASRGILDAFL